MIIYSKVRPREGGPYSLFCYTCNHWVPNTANHEMKKEGFSSHNHFCYIEDGILHMDDPSATPLKAN